MQGLDYTSPIPASELVSRGINDVFRYITTPSYPKSIQYTEYSDLRNKNIRVHLNDETTADFMLGGHPAGVTQAQQCMARRRSFGILDNSPLSTIYYSLDIDATQAQINTALQFLAGAATVDGTTNVGAYGSYEFVRQAIDAGYKGWGTVGWSDGKIDTRAIAWQTGTQIVVAGITCDINQMNPGSTPDMGNPIPASITTKWPDLVADFPPNVNYEDTSGIIWADAGAREAVNNTIKILTAVQSVRDNDNALSQTIAGHLDSLNASIASLTTAVNQLTQTGTGTGGLGATPDEIAAAIVKVLAKDMGAGSGV